MNSILCKAIEKRKKTALLMLLMVLAVNLMGFEDPLISDAEVWLNKEERKRGSLGKSIGVWNVKWFPGGNPKASDKQKQSQIKGVREVLQRETPFLVFLCEVRDLKVLQELNSHALGYKALACTAIPRVEDEGRHLPRQSLAFMSQVSWESSWVIDFSEMALTRDRPRRGVLVLRFSLGAGRKLYVYGVHLKSNLGSFEINRLKRERAMRYIEWDWRRVGINWAKDEVILLGDFNTSMFNPFFEQEKTIKKVLQRGFRDVMEGASWQERLTIFSAYGLPSDVFDYLLVSSDLLAFSHGAKVVSVRQEVSDHHPIFWNVGGLASKLERASDTTMSH